MPGNGHPTVVWIGSLDQYTVEDWRSTERHGSYEPERYFGSDSGIRGIRKKGVPAVPVYRGMGWLRIARWFIGNCFLQFTPENLPEMATYPRFFPNYPRILAKKRSRGDGPGYGYRRRTGRGDKAPFRCCSGWPMAGEIGGRVQTMNNLFPYWKHYVYNLYTGGLDTLHPAFGNMEKYRTCVRGAL